MSATYRAGSFELVESDFDLSELLWTPAAATPLEFEMDEVLEAVHFDPKDHPRWPKGTPKGGQFIRVGQSFSLEGEQFEVAHVVKGKLYAHLKGGKSAKTIEVKVSAAKGFEASHPEEISVAKIQAPAPVPVKGGKGQESTVTAVDPYVDSSTHDPSIPIPPHSQISAEEWKRFGKIDQEHYTELQERFGKWSPGQAKPLVDKAYTDYQKELKDALGAAGAQAAQEAASAVKSGYSMQYGSSSGLSLSLVGPLLKKFGLGHGQELDVKGAEARERAMVLQGEHRAAVQWDLYNRSRSPDISAFHKNSESTSYWDEGFIKGSKRIFSGLSQSFHYRASFFGDNALATPLAIRHVLLASQSAQPIPGSSHFPGELEISVPEQMVLDKRSFTFTFAGSSANGKKLSAGAKKWLESITKVPVSGRYVEQLQRHFEKGEELPIPPEPAMIEMDGQGKVWKDPEPEAWKGISERALLEHTGSDMAIGDHFRKGGTTYVVSVIDADGTVHGKAHGNGTGTATVGVNESVPHAQPVVTAGLKAGDYVMGLQGSRYVVVTDPSDPSGYGLRYVEIQDGGPTGSSYNMKPGALRQFFRLEGSYSPPPPVAVGDQPAFEPGAWTQAAEEPKLVGKLEPGEKFKVEGEHYEVIDQLPNTAQTRIKNLETGKLGKINQSYKTATVVPKAGYAPPGSLSPEKGDWVSLEGEKWEVVGLQKSTGEWRVKRPGKTGVQLLPADHEAFQNIHRPSDYMIGEKAKLRDIAPGEKFHMGAGSKQKPYVVVAQGGSGKPTKVKDLSTGKEIELSRNASYARLVAASDPDKGGAAFATPSPSFAPHAAPEPPTPAEPEPEESGSKPFDAADYETSEKGKNLKGLQSGDIFAYSKSVFGSSQVLKVLRYKGTPDAKGKYPMVEVEYQAGFYAGKTHTISTSKIVYPMTPKVAAPELPISDFDPTKYELGAPTPLAHMDAGAIVKIGAAHWQVNGQKKGDHGIGITSMTTGHESFSPGDVKGQKLVGKWEADAPVAYDALTQGDLVQMDKLKTGDQFTYPGDPNTYSIAVPSDGTWSAMVSHVKDDGSLGPATSTVLGPTDNVAFHKKADDQTTDWWLKKGQVEETDPTSLSKPPGFEGYGSPYASGAKEKNGFSGKHYKVSEMAPGTVFRDKTGAMWKVKTSGAAPIITDGKSNFAVDGQLRGRVALYMGELPHGDSSPPVGQSGIDYAPAAAESLLGPNVGAKELGELPVGTIWKAEHSGEIFMLSDKNEEADSATSVSLKDGHSIQTILFHAPKSVAMPPPDAQKSPLPQPPAESPSADDDGDDGGDELAKAMKAAAAALAGSSPAAAPDPPSPAPKLGEKPLAEFAVGDTLHFGVADWQIEKQSVNAYGQPVTVMKALNGALEGETSVFPGNLTGMPQPTAGGQPLVANPGGLLIAHMNPGDIVQLAPVNGGGTWEVTEKVNGGVMAKSLIPGMWEDGGHLSAHWSPVAMSPGAGAESSDPHEQADKDDALTAALLAVHGGDAPLADPPAPGDEPFSPQTHLTGGELEYLMAVNPYPALGSAIDEPHNGDLLSDLEDYVKDTIVNPPAPKTKASLLAKLVTARKKADAESLGVKTNKDLEAEAQGFAAGVAKATTALSEPPSTAGAYVPAAKPNLHAGLDATLEVIKAQHGGSLAGVPYGDEFQPFKSAWGSGGAYKYPPITEMNFGQKFADKSGSVFRFVSLTGNNQAIIVSESTGAAVKVPAGLRVKTKGV